MRVRRNNAESKSARVKRSAELDMTINKLPTKTTAATELQVRAFFVVSSSCMV